MRSAHPSNSEIIADCRRLASGIRLRLTFLRLTSCIVALLGLAAWGQEPSTPVASGIGAIAPYLGLRIEQISLPGVPPDEASHLLQATPLKLGEALSREMVHDGIQALFATGRFADIQVEAERGVTGVKLRIVAAPNFFVGKVLVEGVTTNPGPNQIVSASRLQLGELYTPEKIDRAMAGIRRVLEENGFYRARVTPSDQRNQEQHLVDITLTVDLGARATIGKIAIKGEAGISKGQIEDVAKMHAGDPVASTRLSRGLQRIRSRYQKQDRLLAQVSVANRDYRPETNTVDYTLQIDPGPNVQIAAEGYKFSQRELRKLVPIYEEGAVDDDLLSEGRRNLQNRLQTLGYFDATVGVSQHTVDQGKTLRVIYVINPSDRHKLTAIRISGNQLFSHEQIRAVMTEQPAGRLFSHGRYSESLLEQDVANIKALYRANGYQAADVTAKLLSSYQQDNFQVAIELTIKEGPQTRVGWVRIDGNFSLPSDQILKTPSTEEGQGFAEANLSEDRDRILAVYFDNGFSNATVDVSYLKLDPSPEGLPQVGVIFKVQEGEQFFVNRVFMSGLHYTRPGVARRELRVNAEAPLSQQDMLETQRRLYDLGLFNEVDTAVENPDGTESRKNVLVAMKEAKRYTFDYGFGFEVQTGQPSIGSNQPLGQTGASPRVSLGITRINLGGRNQTVTLKGSLSRLQQRGLISFDAPKLLYRDLRFTATAFYDNTIDVSTFTSQRTEGSVQFLQVLKKRGEERILDSLSYGFNYRRVKASDVQVSDNLIPLLSRSTRVGLPSFSYIRNRRDNDLESTSGNYTTFESGVASSYFGSEADFSRVLLKNSTYHAFPRSWRPERRFVFARATSIGLENPLGSTVLIGPADPIPAGHTLIPLPERFFSGGGNSHRGFGLNQAGPRDPFTGFPVGGSGLFVNNHELRFPNVTLPYLHDNIGFTVFHDMGNVFDTPQHMLRSLGRWHQATPSLCTQERTHTQCDYNYISHAIGVGMRYQTPIGPLRLDFGYNLNPPTFPSYTNVVVNTVNGQRTGQFGFQQAGHFNFSFSVGQSF